jgi:hypothetical protein
MKVAGSPFVKMITLIDEGDQHISVDENHLRRALSLRRMCS